MNWHLSRSRWIFTGMQDRRLTTILPEMSMAEATDTNIRGVAGLTGDLGCGADRRPSCKSVPRLSRPQACYPEPGHRRAGAFFTH